MAGDAGLLTVNALQVDVYSFAMILYQLFEHTPPFAGVDPVEAAKMAGLENKRPKLEKLAESKSPMPVSTSPQIAHTNMVCRFPTMHMHHCHVCFERTHHALDTHLTKWTFRILPAKQGRGIMG